VTNIHCLLYLAHFFLVWEVFQRNVVEKIKTHILYSILFFANRAFYKIMWKKYCRAWQATDDNMAHAHCMLNTEAYKYIQVVQYLLLFYCNNGCTNAPQCYVIRTLPVLLNIVVTTWNLFGDVCCEDAVFLCDCYSICDILSNFSL
jgi:hypothetical protein